MKTTLEPILFFGSGPVAAKSLEALCENFSVQAVITKAIPLHHHYEAPVVSVAEKKSKKLYFVRDKLELEELLAKDATLQNIKIGVLVDFGIIISKATIEHFSMGIVNSHFSLLPQWRGADPITYSILSGQSETGVSLMLISQGMDEGRLLAQETYRLRPSVTTPQLTSGLVELSNKMLSEYLPPYVTGKLKPYEQDQSIPPTYSRKLTKEDGEVNWEKSAEELEREIRAFIEWPKCHAKINDVEVILTGAHVITKSGVPGTIEPDNELLIIHCGDESLAIDRLKPSGKREMTGSDFKRGYLR